MSAMDSTANYSSSRRPKLDRRNAQKINYIEPSSSPSPSPSPSPLFSSRTPSARALARLNSQSLRVTGEGQFEQICKELGLPGGADAFSIPQEQWEAGKAKTGSVDHFISEHKARSRSLDEPSSSFFVERNRDSRFASPQYRSTGPFHDSLSSSSGDSFASDASLTTGEKALPGPLDNRTERTSSSHVLSEPHLRDGHRKTTIDRINKESRAHNDSQNFDNVRMSNNSIRTDYQHFDNALRLAEDPGKDVRLHRSDRRPHANEVHGSPSHDARTDDHDDCDRCDNSETAHSLTRLSKSFDQVTGTNTDVRPSLLLPPPFMGTNRTNSDFSLHSTKEILAGFGPNEDLEHNEKRLSDDDDDNCNSAPKDQGFVAGSSEDDTTEQSGFVKEVIQQHADFAKEQIHREDSSPLTSQTPERSTSNVSIHSWMKQDLLGSGSFGTVYEAVSE